jgi:predicted DNA-binding protein (UPF0251 family)
MTKLDDLIAAAAKAKIAELRAAGKVIKIKGGDA